MSAQFYKADIDLESAKVAAVESEQSSAHIMTGLHSQREIMIRTQDNLRTTNYEIDESRNIISRMSRTVLQNRLILRFAFGLVIGVCLFIVVNGIRKAFL
eukprot:GHVP01053184.1.p1 GENE.GHVP01053184.1~~GHVP01053184.1.p1  ORF type:complete len:100 (+),score=10.05 GHVP01053184.1:109-408(+)